MSDLSTGIESCIPAVGTAFVGAGAKYYKKSVYRSTTSGMNAQY